MEKGSCRRAIQQNRFSLRATHLPRACGVFQVLRALMLLFGHTNNPVRVRYG